MAHDGTGAGWDITAPADSDAIALGAQEIRDLRRGVETRVNREHVTAAAASVGGWHKSGSAKAYYQSASPTNRPDGATALTADDNGRIFVDSDDHKVYVYVHGTGFVQLRGFIENNTITLAMMTDDSVSGAEIVDDAIDTIHIADGAVETAQIADGAVTVAKIPDGEITLAKLDTTGIRFRSYEALYEDRKSSGTSGGNSVASTWTKHDLTTEVYDESTVGSLASSQITLAAGTYRVMASAVFRTTQLSSIRVRDVTNNTTLALGMSNRFANGSNAAGEVSAIGFFTLAGATVLELQYYTETAETDGLGLGVASGELEVYARVHVMKYS